MKKELGMNKTLALMILCVLGATTVTVPLFADVVTEVSTDIYILPVAELASTKTYPDVITLANERIEVELVPNRGRVLLGLTSLKHEVNFLHRNPTPDPMVLASGLYGVEFGGYYLSLPWNTRDRQPFDLQFEIKNSDPDTAEVYLSGKDMFVRTLTECWVRMHDDSNVVEIEVEITNTSKRSAKEFDFRDFSLFTVDTPGRDGNKLILPVDKTAVIRSEGDWLGEPGTEVDWTPALQTWGRIHDYYETKSVNELLHPCAGVYYPELKAACVKFWEGQDFFSGVEAWAWGNSYDRVKGSGPYFGISTTASKIKLEPQQKIGFRVFFAVLDGLDSEPTAGDLYERAKVLVK
jgi:hypothetical protein